MRMRLRLYGSLILVLLLAVGTCYYYFGLLLPSAVAGGYSYGGDFYPLWLTGRELGEGMLFLIFPWIAVLLSLLVLVLSAWPVRCGASIRMG